MTPSLLLLLLARAHDPDAPPEVTLAVARGLPSGLLWPGPRVARGLGRPEARHLYSGQVRWRFLGGLYALGEGGTLLSPTPEGAPCPGAFASFGLGVDDAR